VGQDFGEVPSVRIIAIGVGILVAAAVLMTAVLVLVHYQDQG